MIATFGQEVDSMKNSVTLAAITLLLGCVPVRLTARGIQPNPALADLQTALDLDRRGEYRGALQKYQALLSNATANRNPQLRAYVLQQMADADNGLGDYAKGEEKAREVLRLLAGANERNTSMFAIAEGVLADALASEGNYLGAKKMAAQAVSLGRKTISAHAPRFGILLTTLAHALEVQGEHRHALKLYQRVVGVMEKAGEGNRIELGTAYLNLAGAYLAKGKAKKALELVALALAAWKQVLPSNNPFTVYALSLEMLGYEKLKAYREAEALIPETLEVGLSQLGPDHPDRVMLLDIGASVYVAQKKYKLAAPLLKQGVELGKRLFRLGNPVSRTVLANYSHVLAELGQTEEASRVRAESQVLLAFPERYPMPGVQ
jgi:tetratricopeptide (TPR) repeat protein